MEIEVKDNDFNQLLLHYIFSDENDHALNAFTRNECEKQFLSMINEIAYLMDLHATIQVMPAEEGSLKDKYNFLVSNNGATLATWATLLLNLFSNWFPKQSKLEKLNSEADLILKANEIEKEGLPVPENMQETIKKIYKSNKLKKQKSNFFKALKKENKIQNVEVLLSNTTTKKEKSFANIARSDFDNYILESDDLDSVIDNNAVIKVIAPVLVGAKYSWRGIYEKDNCTHEFAMLDKTFRKGVEEGLPFQNGTQLICELEICRKLNDAGDVVSYKYKINKVHSTQIGSAITKIPHNNTKPQIYDQPSLFSEYDF